jgi:hypothetical protein
LPYTTAFVFSTYQYTVLQFLKQYTKIINGKSKFHSSTFIGRTLKEKSKHLVPYTGYAEKVTYNSLTLLSKKKKIKLTAFWDIVPCKVSRMSYVSTVEVIKI